MTGTDGLFRARTEGGPAHGEVKFVELFFDLVFVFAITQLSHLLIGHLSIVGALQTALLLLAVWWVWIDTSWVMNWLDPDSSPVRILLFVMMLAGLLLSASIPEAFDERGAAFAFAYAFIQLGRCGFMLWALRSHSERNFRNFQRIAVWCGLSAMVWIVGAFVEPSQRLIVWAVAVAIDTAAPSLGFWVPGLGRSTTADWDVAGDHIAERCGLFVIIALGESILVTGATFAELVWSEVTLAAFIVGVVGSIAMWWIYFHIGAERARRQIRNSDDPGRSARLAYTYIHVVLIAGIIVSAAADEIIMKHPLGHADPTTVAVMLGGPAVFLLGNLLFKWATAGWPPLSHMVGLAILAALVPAAPGLAPVALGAATTAVLLIVAVWEARSLASSSAREAE